jgi:hypothetical protein
MLRKGPCAVYLVSVYKLDYFVILQERNPERLKLLIPARPQAGLHGTIFANL